LQRRWQVFRMVGVEGYTMNATRLAFNREGVRPPSGEFWSPKYIREAIKDNQRQSANGDRFWELSGGVLYCAECGCRMTVHATLDSRNGRRYCYYRCQKRGGHGVQKVCINGKHHRAAEAETAVWNVVSGLLKDPERLRAGLDEMIEQERAGMRGNPDQEAASWLEKISEVEQERRGYLRFAAKGHMGDDELEEALAEAEMLRSGSRMLQRAETYCLYNIEYRRGNSQIHHQAAPSRAQAPGAAVIGGS
jgi:Recombinase zinc beta ribbon domain